MNKADTSLVRARGLCKNYGSGEGLVRAIDEVNLEVARGQTLAIMGPSGCGKSTLLHLLGGLDRPSAGELWLGDRRIDRLSERGLAHFRRSEVGFVFQAFHLMDELTAQENVELPALLAGRSSREAQRRARELLEQVASLIAPGTFPRCFRVASARESLSLGRSPMIPRWSSRTSRPATSTALPPWRCCDCSRVFVTLVSPSLSLPTTNGSLRPQTG